jgi:hypothetical protein
VRSPAFAALVLFAVLSAVLVGCGGGGDSPSAVTCARLDGTWNVALDDGNGMVGQQRWILTQNQCELALTGDPSDEYGPSLGVAVGNAGVDGLWATWTKTVDTCRYYSRLDATVNGNALSGTLNWSRGAYGQGYCSSGTGRIVVSGRRQ